MNTTSNDVTVLAALYNNLYNEITRYRDYEWKVTAYVGGLYVWTISMMLNGKIIDEGSGCLARSLWTFVALGIYAFAITALAYVHFSLNAKRNQRTKIEHVFALHDTDWLSKSGKEAPVGWERSDFERVMDTGAGRKIKGYSEGKGVFFVICFNVYVSLLFIYNVVVVWTR